MTLIPPSVRPLSGTKNPISLHQGQTTTQGYRGPRLSIVFVSLIENFISDLIAIKKRLLLINPFGIAPTLLNNSPLIAGIYGLGNQDNRQDPYLQGIISLQPSLVFSNIVEIQYLRTQINFRLSTLV